MRIKKIVLFIGVLSCSPYSITQLNSEAEFVKQKEINCDSEWVKQKEIRSVLIEPKILRPDSYIEYFEYAPDGNLIYHEKCDDDDKYITQFNHAGLLTWEISFRQVGVQSTRWDTAVVHQYCYDFLNNLKTSRYVNYDSFKEELYISFSSHIFYDYSDSLIIITAEDYNDFTGSREILLEERILNHKGQDSIITLKSGERDQPLVQFLMYKITYDSLDRVKNSETVSSTLIGITNFVYYGETEFKITETTMITNIEGVFQEKKITEYYPGSNELKRTTVTNSKNQVEIRPFDKDKISCGLKFHLKNVRSEKAKVTIKYF